MFCERCGAQLTEGNRFCSSCGKPQGVAMVPAERRSRVQQHVQTLAILWIVYGVLAVLGAFAVFTIEHAVLGSVFRYSDAFPAAPLVHTVLTVVATWKGLKGVVAIIAGWGLLERNSWARPMAIVASFLSLLSIPFGTALGIYCLWVLMPDSSGQEYDQISQAA
jgi:hypothetical protein